MEVGPFAIITKQNQMSICLSCRLPIISSWWYGIYTENKRKQREESRQNKR